MSDKEFYIDRMMDGACDVSLERSVIIETPPEDILPWLEQMYGEAGGYTFDFIENLRSKNLKHTKSYPLGTKAGDKMGVLDVLDVDPEEGITYDFSYFGAFKGMMGYYLEPISPAITRLLVKIKLNFTNPLSPIFWAVVHPIDFVLMNQQLSNIKEYAEDTCNKTNISENSCS